MNCSLSRTPKQVIEVVFTRRTRRMAGKQLHSARRRSPDRAGPAQKALLYHFCRLQLPFLALSLATFEQHLRRCYDIYRAKQQANNGQDGWPAYLTNLYAVDWFLCCACLEGQQRAWECLFAAR